MPVPHVPEGQPAVQPFLCVADAKGLAEFVVAVFDARLTECSTGDDGTLRHGELALGGSKLMVGEAGGRWGATPGALYVYVPDTDTAYRRALRAGATWIAEPQDKPYQERQARVRDSFGNTWWIATFRG